MKSLIKPIFFLIALSMCFSLLVCAADSSGLVAENLDLTTYRNISVGGQLAANGSVNSKLTFEIVTPPSKGTIDLNEDGSFVYTPKEGKKGKDYFGYKAIAEDGRSSQEATVIIRIKKQKNNLSYSDLSECPEEYAATVLAEEGIFVGENIGGKYVFSPNRDVSRAEFLSMCMKLIDEDILTGVTRTGFADDESIQPWLKPYVSTALSCGLISGYSTNEENAVFDADRSITAAEAAVMLDRALDLSDVPTTYMYEEAVPVWACQSAANLTACNLVPYGVDLSKSVLTRADAAMMLAKAISLMK